MSAAGAAGGIPGAYFALPPAGAGLGGALLVELAPVKALGASVPQARGPVL